MDIFLVVSLLVFILGLVVMLAAIIDLMSEVKVRFVLDAKKKTLRF